MMAFCGEWPDVSPCNNELATCTAVEQRELKSALRPDHVLQHVNQVSQINIPLLPGLYLAACRSCLHIHAALELFLRFGTCENL